VKTFSAEAIKKTRGLPLYEGGPGVNYKDAPHAFALNATLLYDPRRSPQEVAEHGPSKDAEILLVERASGHGEVGSFSGVSGYIDRPWYDDPIAYTLKEEFETECGFTRHQFRLVAFYAGQPTVENRTWTPGAKITVVPILGLCTVKPKIIVN